MKWRGVPRPMWLVPQVRELIESLLWTAHGAKSRAGEIGLSVFSPDEPYMYVARVERIRLELDWAFFNLAFNATEAWLVEKAYGSGKRKYAKDALAIVVHDAVASLNDPNEMANRMEHLQALRNEITHRSGRWEPRKEHVEAMNHLEANGDIRQVEDPEGHEKVGLIEIRSLDSLLKDLAQIVVVCSTDPNGWAARAQQIADHVSPDEADFEAYFSSLD